MQSYTEYLQHCKVVILTKATKDQLKTALEDANKADISDEAKAQLKKLHKELRTMLYVVSGECTIDIESFYIDILSKANALQDIKDPAIVQLVKLLQEAYSQAQPLSGLSL